MKLTYRCSKILTGRLYDQCVTNKNLFYIRRKITWNETRLPNTNLHSQMYDRISVEMAFYCEGGYVLLCLVSVHGLPPHHV